MSDTRTSTPNDSLDLGSPSAVEDLARRFDATPTQIREAAVAVGHRIADIEMHLKGTRSASNEERMEQAPPSGARP
ncbi:hypothetical protein GCM10023165_49730 [Variovorax defluvii]|uniref:DUF3606 domain-containing protein n=1 Tax=Variovorax defluvii TaxID=913761 RepID=A0ABP8IDU7_9BURK